MEALPGYLLLSKVNTSNRIWMTGMNKLVYKNKKGCLNKTAHIICIHFFRTSYYHWQILKAQLQTLSRLQQSFHPVF